MSLKALGNLFKSISNEESEKYPENLFNRLRSLVNLLTPKKQLNSSALSECNEIFSGHMVTLYQLRPAVAMKFSLSIIMEVFKSRLTPILKLNQTEDDFKNVKLNEEVLRTVFNGIQNYLECDKPDSEQVGSALYKPLLGILGSTLGLKLSARIRSQAYGLISDTAERSMPNKLLLKDKSILGGSRLGRIIASTNDYLVLDTLLQLLARITPSAQDASGRKELAKEVFQSAKMLKVFGKPTCEELSLLLENATGDQWEMISDRIIATLAKVDSQKPQPFVLTCREIHANSYIFPHPKSLDKIYMDSDGFIFNIQEGDAVDCLEVNYCSVTSIQLQERPQGSLFVELSLSSPPLKGFEAVTSTSGSHTVAFAIFSSQALDFVQTLRRRKLGVAIEHKPTIVFETKHSLADPLNFSGFYTSEGKSQEVENFYASSVAQSSNHSLEDGHAIQIGVASILDNIDEAGSVPKKKSLQENLEFVSLKQLENDDPSRINRLKEPKHPILRNQVTAVNCNFSDVECAISKGFMTPRKASGSKDASLTKERKRRSENEIARFTDVSVPVMQPGMENKTPLSERATSSATFKRKRDKSDVDGPGESEKNIDKAVKSRAPYNSQLLMPQETAAVRSTTKYRTRAKNALLPLSPSINIDEPPVKTTPSVIKSRLKPRPDGKPPVRPVKKKARAVEGKVPFSSAQTNPIKSKRHTKEECGFVSGEETVARLRPRRITKRVKVESDKKQEDNVEVPSAGTKAKFFTIPTTKELIAMRPTPVLSPIQNQQVFEIPNPSKKLPWKDLGKSALVANNNTVEKITEVDITSLRKVEPNPPNLKLKEKEMEKSTREDILLATQNNISPSTVVDYTLKAIQSIDARSSPLILPQIAIPLEPLDLDIAIAQAENFCMDIDVPFDHGDLGAILPISTSNDPFEEVNGQNEVSEAKSDVQQTRTGREDYRKLALKDVTCIELPFSVRSSSPAAIPLPSKSILRKPAATVDLTHLDNSEEICFDDKQSNADILEVDDLPNEEPIVACKKPVPVQLKKPSKSSSQRRPGVTFAVDTKRTRSLSKSPARHRIDRKIMNRTGYIPSMIPRLVAKREAKAVIFATPAEMKKMQKIEVPRDVRKIHSSAPHNVIKNTCVTDSDLDEDEVQRELSPDEKIVNVLNDIQGVILDNLSRKFNTVTANTQNAVRDLRSFAAEELHKMLENSIKHRKNLVHLEERYGHYGRQLQQGFDEIARANENIDKRLRQAILDHDQKGLKRIMPQKLAARPKIFQNLAASSSA